MNLIPTDWDGRSSCALLGWQSTPRHWNAALLTFPHGMNLVLHEPEFARLWDPPLRGGRRLDLVDVNLPRREAVHDTHAQVVATGHTSSVEPWGHLLRRSLRHRLRS